LRVKRILAVLLGISLLVSPIFTRMGLVRATELQILEKEPAETCFPETQPSEAYEPTAAERETVPPATQTQETEAPVTEPQELATEPLMTKPPETEPMATEAPTTEPAVTVPPATEDVLPVIVSETEAAEIMETVPEAGEQDGDLHTVSGQGISFRLFNYATSINKASSGAAWRPVSSYFTFRNSKMENGTDATTVNIPSPTTNADHDQDGFTKYHATVERILDGGYPVLDLTRNADGSGRTDPGIAKSTRSLGYLFSSGDHAVTAYSPRNTILQQSGSHYWYDSAEHAVDYDLTSNVFRLRSYPERNSTTAAYGTAYGDFLPFTYTGGNVIGTTEDGISYHVDTADTDYWFGMTMQVNFFQTKNGKLGQENMIFRFSGDDDVWVFVDGVLVLDLGGTHGTVNGSIDFATGEILQYLTWGGANATAVERTGGSDTSFPTSLRSCFDAAGKEPRGGWSADGQTFADYSEHTLQFFYLERGSAVANCSLDFRLPTLPDESLTVTKDLRAATDAPLRDYIAEGLEYRFRVMKADASGNATQTPFLSAGMTYELMENGVKVGHRTVGEDNSFLLKAGQSAQFTQMLYKGDGATRYVVEEIMPDDLTGQYKDVMYMVSGSGGETITEKDPSVRFTAFQTPVLSAEQTQTVIFENRVDTEKLGTLKITKREAPGTQIPADLFFPMQVKLEGVLLPVGTVYMVGDEQRLVETAGVLLLRADETAVIAKGILAGTQYSVTELSSSIDGYRAAYTGTAEPSGEVSCTQDGAAGEFPLGGTVHITVTNADYDFSVRIPISKRVLDFRGTSEFRFKIERLEQSDGSWKVVDTLPEMVIAVSDAQTAEDQITIGYRSDMEEVFYYRITEVRGTENYLYDTAVFFVEVTVSNGTAEITDIQRNGKPADSVSFINRAVTTLTVTKTITGGSGSKKFSFTAEVFLDGEPFELPETDVSCNYTAKGNVISFWLGHDESLTLACIPIDATVIIKEMGYDGFLVFNRLESVDEAPVSGASREIQFSNAPQTIHFTNQTGFRLPNTGGMGTTLHTAGGVLLSFGAGAVSLYKQSQKERRKKHPPII